MKEQQLGTNPNLKDTDFDGLIDSEDEEPLKTNINSNVVPDYNIPIKIGTFDLDTKYVDKEGNRYEIIYNYSTNQTSYISDTNNSVYYTYDKDNNLSATIEYTDKNMLLIHTLMKMII